MAKAAFPVWWHPNHSRNFQHQPGEGWDLEEPCVDPTCAPAPHSILVVEDEVLVRLMIADDLMQAGFHVIQAATADDALKVLESSVKVNLVMTDVRMPGSFDGLELAHRVRANWPQLKIMVLSSEHQSALVRAPIDAFLGKPYRPADLLDRVNRLLSNP